MSSMSMVARRRAAIVARLRAAGSVWAEDEADLLISSAASPAELHALVGRRVDGQPLEHILGWARFCGLRVVVAPGVFIPRTRTELLVRTAVTLIDHRDAVVLDLCCGSGAVGAAIASTAAGQIDLFAVDIDPASIACAHRNLEPWGARVYEGDLFTPLPDHLLGSVDLLVANVPYVPTGAIGLLPREARLYESLIALDGGVDGLDLLRRVGTEAPHWLAPHGHFIVETSQAQSPTTVEVLQRAGLTARVVTDAQLDATAVIATR